MLEDIWWRVWGCPRTLEAAAIDFLNVRNGPKMRKIFSDPASIGPATAIDLKRRIAAIYGLARWYNLHDIWSPGWNRTLLNDVGPDPEQAVERVLKRVCELAKCDEAPLAPN